jgi:hypothetical protein
MFRRSLIIFLLTLLAFATPAAAQFHRPYYGGGVMRLEPILPQIRMTHPGRFYDAEGPFADGAGGMHYRIKWLTPEGRVIWFDVDARTGRVLGPAGVPAPVGGRFGPGPGGPGRAFPPPWRRPGIGGWPGRPGRR